MTQPLRVEFPGAVYHVTARGDGREAIFVDDHDRGGFLAVLGHVLDRFAWRCHAYCLMENHYHLLLETPEANLAPGATGSLAARALCSSLAVLSLFTRP